MSKDAYYFSHDSNARNDQRLMKVRMQYGMEGYGVYFGIIEILREQKDYTLTFDDIDSISFDLRVDKEKIEDIVENYDLFEIKGHTMFYSKSLMRRMLALDEKRQKLASAGKKGGLSKARKMLEAKSKQGSSSKVKESKVNKNKVNDINKRMLLFKESLEKHSNQYNKDIIENFFNYWSEPNKSNTKMKFEQQTTWDISRRLKRWASYDFGNSKKEEISRPVVPKYVAPKIDDKDIATEDERKEILNIRRPNVKSV